MSEITVESGLQIPRKGGGSIYPFERLEVGDSFFIAGLTAAQLSTYGWRWGQRRGAKFSARTVTEGGKQGARIWRVK